MKLRDVKESAVAAMAVFVGLLMIASLVLLAIGNAAGAGVSLVGGAAYLYIVISLINEDDE